MRVNDGLPVDLLGLDHLQQFDGVIQVADAGNVHSRVNLTGSHQLQGTGDVPG